MIPGVGPVYHSLEMAKMEWLFCSPGCEEKVHTWLALLQGKGRTEEPACCGHLLDKRIDLKSAKRYTWMRRG